MVVRLSVPCDWLTLVRIMDEWIIINGVVFR